MSGTGVNAWKGEAMKVEHEVSPVVLGGSMPDFLAFAMGKMLLMPENLTGVSYSKKLCYI